MHNTVWEIITIQESKGIQSEHFFWGVGKSAPLWDQSEVIWRPLDPQICTWNPFFHPWHPFSPLKPLDLTKNCFFKHPWDPFFIPKNPFLTLFPSLNPFSIPKPPPADQFLVSLTQLFHFPRLSFLYNSMWSSKGHMFLIYHMIA